MEARIESLEISFQVVVLCVCGIIALVRMRSLREKSALLLFAFYGSFLLGDLYWQVCLLAYGDIPQISLVSDLSWYAALLFLYLLLRTAGEARGHEAAAASPVKTGLPWLAPVFTAVMAVFYIRQGKIVSNIVYAALMGLLLYEAVKGLLSAGRVKDSAKPLHRLIFLFCALEYALWTVSCFWDLEGCRYAYFGIDILITLSFPFYLPIIKREVQS